MIEEISKLDLNDTLGIILGLKSHPEFIDGKRQSTLLLALKSARYLTGRNIETGKYVNPVNPANFEFDMAWKVGYHSTVLIGLTNYLIFLDLIGCVFVPKNRNRKHSKVEFEDALYFFANNSSLSKSEMEALKQLRNSLAHNFGLATPGYNFSLSPKYAHLIKLPLVSKRESTEASSKKSSFTEINELKLCELVEDVYATVCSEFKDGNITIRPSLSKNELIERFTLE